MLDAQCKSHRLRINSNYGTEALAAVHAVDDAYPTLITLQEFRHGALPPEEIKNLCEQGGLKIDTTLTMDAEKRVEEYVKHRSQGASIKESARTYRMAATTIA